jgi:WXG100 family type VII secretion target
MATAANQLQNAVDQVQSQQRTLTGEQESMMGAWKGDAASAFTNAFMQFNADYSKVIQAMQRIQEALAANLRNYTANEAANTTLSTKVSSALNG